MKGVIQRAVGFYEAVEQTGFTVSLRFRENAEEMTERNRIQELNVKGCRDARHWKQMKYVFFFHFQLSHLALDCSDCQENISITTIEGDFLILI